MTEEIFADTDLMYDVYGKGFIIYRDSLHHIFNHTGKFIVHDHLTVVNRHAHFDHTQAVNQIGACQSW